MNDLFSVHRTIVLQRHVRNETQHPRIRHSRCHTSSFLLVQTGPHCWQTN